MRNRLLTTFVVLAAAAVIPAASAQTRQEVADSVHYEPIETVTTIPFPRGAVPQDPKTGATNFSADLAPDGQHIIVTSRPPRVRSRSA